MTNLNGLAATLHAIQAAYTKLEKGKLTQEELDLLLTNSREIYERAVVLQYKFYEEKVFGVKEEEVKPIDNVAQKEVKPIESPEMVDEVINEVAIEEVIEEIAEEQPAFDFSLFDDSAEEVKNEELEDEAIEHISINSTTSDEGGLHEERIVMEQVTLTPTGEENQRFIERYSKHDPNFSNQIAMSKLETLVGSFGLNERLHYINELFDGSSEVFADAVKAINTLSSLEEALIVTSKFANQYNWEIDSETVEEFVFKIKRRYA